MRRLRNAILGGLTMLTLHLMAVIFLLQWLPPTQKQFWALWACWVWFLESVRIHVTENEP